MGRDELIVIRGQGVAIFLLIANLPRVRLLRLGTWPNQRARVVLIEEAEDLPLVSALPRR